MEPPRRLFVFSKNLGEHSNRFEEFMPPTPVRRDRFRIDTDSDKGRYWLKRQYNSAFGASMEAAFTLGCASVDDVKACLPPGVGKIIYFEIVVDEPDEWKDLVHYADEIGYTLRVFPEGGIWFSPYGIPACNVLKVKVVERN